VLTRIKPERAYKKSSIEAKIRQIRAGRRKTKLESADNLSPPSNATVRKTNGRTM
jgi:hypothetical protein